LHFDNARPGAKVLRSVDVFLVPAPVPELRPLDSDIYIVLRMSDSIGHETMGAVPRSTSLCCDDLCHERGQTMTENRIAVLRHRLSRVPTRRDVLRGIAGAGFGLGVARWQDAAEAKQKHMHNNHKSKQRQKYQAPELPQPIPNQFGCLGVGQACRGDSSLCCSSICEGGAPKKGKPDTRVCAAHGQGTCDQAAPAIGTATDPAQALCNGSIGACLATTAGSIFCGDVSGLSDCASCRTDADCEALGFPAGSACAVVTGVNCVGVCPGGLACVAPRTAAPPPS
jgi:hypothetical protein